MTTPARNVIFSGELRDTSPGTRELDLFNHIKDLEQSLHSETLRSNSDKAASLFHPQFKEIGRSGRQFDKSSILRLMREESFEEEKVYSRDYQLQSIGDELVQLTYKSAIKNSQGQLTAFSIRSSLWQKQGDKWLLRFHQGTPTSSFSLTD